MRDAPFYNSLSFIAEAIEYVFGEYNYLVPSADGQGSTFPFPDKSAINSVSQV